MRGETVILIDTIIEGVDPFGAPITSEIQIQVDDVIIGSPSVNDAVNELNLTGKSLLFTLGIPKTDTHDWKDKTVIIRGQRFRTYGFPLTQTAANVPGRWNTQVKVEAYE